VAQKCFLAYEAWVSRQRRWFRAVGRRIYGYVDDFEDYDKNEEGRSRKVVQPPDVCEILKEVVFADFLQLKRKTNSKCSKIPGTDLPKFSKWKSTLFLSLFPKQAIIIVML